jgi:hypothetical protein
VDASDPTARANPRAGGVLVLAGLAALVVTIAITAAFPTGARPAVFIAGLAVAGTLWIWGGLQARAALIRGVPHTARTIVLGIVAFTMGGVAAIGCLSGLLTAAF